MVIKEAAFHFNPIMRTLNDLRKDGVMFDVRVVFGDKEIPAHKCILVASSDYFKSLFLGPVKTDSDKVDLSSVAMDFSSVEAVIDFLYTGKINIEDENLEALLKLSKFLLLREIEGLCESYMSGCNSLESYLNYYILSEEYMLDEDTRDLFATTLQTRFHDFFTFKESTKEIDVLHLKQLMRKYQIFQHCEAGDILSYVVDWLQNGKTGMTEEYEQLGIEILEIIEQKMKLLDKQQHQHVLVQLREKFGAGEMYLKFKEKLNQMVDGDLAGKLESVKVDGEATDAEKVAENLDSEHDVEDVVIAFVPKRRLKEFLNSTICRKTVEGDDGIFDLCVYVPRRKIWYYLAEGSNKSVFKHIGKRNYDLSRSWYMFIGSLRERFESDWTINCCTLDYICCASPSKATIHIYHLKHHSWESFSYQNLVSNFPDFDHANDVRLCCRNGEQLVMVIRKRVLINDSQYKISFKCYTRGTQTQAFWSLMFQTPFMDQTEESRLNGGKFDVCIAQDGKQIYIVNGGDSIQAFVANLDTPSSEVKPIDVASNYDDMDLDRVWLLQNEEQVYVIEQKYYDGDASIYFKCRQVNKVYEPDTLYLDEWDELTVEVSYPDEDNPSSSLEKMVCCTSHGKFFWMVSADGKFRSSIDSVSVDRDGCMKEAQHTPPPFSAVTTVVAGTLRSAHLAQLQPIKHFLQD